MEQLAEDYGPTAVVLLEYYLSTDYRGAGVRERAFDDYDVPYTPTVYFNGPQNAAGLESYDEYGSRVNDERAKESSIVITVDKAVSGSKLAVNAEVLNGDGGAVIDSDVWFVLYEDVGSSEKHYVVLDIERGGAVDSLPEGGTESFSEEFDLSDSETGNVEAVVFLQSAGSSREVLQAALAS